MKNKVFWDEQHAKLYLNNSVIRYKNLPIFIQDIQEVLGKNNKFKVIYNILGQDEAKILFLPNKNIDMNPVPLGFLNSNVTSWYISRIPVRNWKIGLNHKSFSYSIALSNHQRNRKEERELFELRVDSKELKNCILGKYPSYRRSREKVDNGERICYAFSRRFAIHKKGLIYKCFNDPVGKLYINRLPVLLDKYEFLAEILEEDLKP